MQKQIRYQFSIRLTCPLLNIVHINLEIQKDIPFSNVSLYLFKIFRTFRQFPTYSNGFRRLPIFNFLYVNFLWTFQKSFHEYLEIWSGNTGLSALLTARNNPVVVWSKTTLNNVLLQAWALTIHKSKGLTLPKAWIDIGKSERTAGVSYVAISRVKSFASCVIEPMTYERLTCLKSSANLRYRLAEENRLDQLAQTTSSAFRTENCWVLAIEGFHIWVPVCTWLIYTF